MRSILCGLLLLLACGAEEARVDELLDSGPAPLPLRLESVEGLRDGASTRATLVFSDGPAARMSVQLVLTYDPQPVLESGRWTYRGPSGEGSGGVRAESVRFVGGQGEGASVGGTYLLVDGDRLRFRVRLPLTGLRAPFDVGDR